MTLEDKIYVFTGRRDEHLTEYCKSSDVRCAVEELRKQIDKYPNIELTHTTINGIIDEVFGFKEVKKP